jgi:ubiquinone/menaquinone biosynthesis C-methylase UbiE
MNGKLSFYEHLTKSPEEAKWIWADIVEEIKKVGREDILSNPTVLDIGGGMGEFSRQVNSQGVRCVNLDVKNLAVDRPANPVRGQAYRMPFVDARFDIIHGCGVFDSNMYRHDFPKLIQEIARVLKAKGILSVYDFTPPPAEELEKLFRRLSAEDKEYPTLWEKK